MYKQIAQNKRNTVLLFGVFVLLVGAIGGLAAWLARDWWVEIWVIGIAILYALLQYFMASRVAVAMTGAKKIVKKDYPKFYNIVEDLAIQTGLPMPEVYVVEDLAPNAFATGRDPKHAKVAATTGLLKIMNEKELTAVMAHEMSHVKNYDIRISTMVFGLTCVVGLVADLGIRLALLGGGRRRGNDEQSPLAVIFLLLAAILAPLIAMLMKMAVSRQREYLADASAVNLTRYPEGMISALKKLSEHAQPMKNQNSATEALYISNPLRKASLSSLFSTHPPLEKRIERLENGKNIF